MCQLPTGIYYQKREYQLSTWGLSTYGGVAHIRNYFASLIVTRFLASDWNLQGSFCCICVLALKLYSLSLQGQRGNGAVPESLLETEKSSTMS